MVEISGGQIGAFEIIAPIGSGGFATVYKALDTRFDSPVAIKILADNHALNPEMRERFITEAQTLRRIGAPTTLAVYDIGETPDRRPYLVLELAGRGNLVTRRAELLANGWHASTSDASALVNALGMALAVVHGHGLIHRDIAPSNILIRSGCDPRSTRDRWVLRPDEQLVVADLGLVKDLAAGSGLTTGGGTVGFSSPEQRTPLGLVDARTDVYAASAVVRWLISPSGAEIKSDWATTLRTAGWPGGFVDGLERGLADHVEDRHDSIERWREDLERGLASQGQLVTQHRTGPNDVPRNKWQKALVGAAAAAAVGVAGFAVGSTRTTTPSVDGTPIALAAPPLAERVTPEAAVEPEPTAPATPEPIQPLTPEAPTVDPVPDEVASQSITAVPAPAESTAPVPATAVPATAVPATPEPTPAVVDANAAVPQIPVAVVRFVDDQNWRLVIAWGGNPSASVLHTQIQVAANGGPWVFEVIDAVPVAAGWELWSTGDPDDRTQVRPDASYTVRVRWTLTNGQVSDWSPLVVAGLEP